jgi:hypothetical protein
MLAQLEDAPTKGAGRIKDAIAIDKPAIAEGDQDLAFGHDLAVKIGNTFTVFHTGSLAKG